MLVTSDITARTTAYADRRLLTRAIPNNILGQWGQTRPVPGNKGIVIKFRRYNKLAAATTPLAEGVTPTGNTLTKTDVTATLAQYGDFIRYTDVIRDTHEDPVLKEMADISGEQAAETWDVLRFAALKVGTNVLYTNGTARSSVNTAVSRDLFRKAERTLRRQHAKPIMAGIKAGPDIATFPVPPCFPAVCHIDLKYDLEQIADFTPPEQYASASKLFNGEMGAVGPFRFVEDNNCEPWEDSGGACGSMISTSATSADVYPILVFGRDSYGLCPLGGEGSVQTIVNNPKGSDTDPLAQRGTYGWKGWTTTVILNDLWMLRIEAAATNG